MKHIIGCLYLVCGSLLVTACGGSKEAKSPSEGGATRQTLSLSGECSFEACGSMPSSLASAPKVECGGGSSEACAWSAEDANASVSFRQCAEAECPPKPAVDCPADTVQSSQYCGSENSGPCAWTTVCVPPRITTPCPEADGCAGQPVPAIGIICKDGSSGGMTCVTDGQKCFLERDCD
jgi:hypothetical protein